MQLAARPPAGVALGARRNPWNEIECGHLYARAMASRSLLLALSGFSYSAPEQTLRLRPRVSPAAFRCLFSSGTSWGVYSQQPAEFGIAVHGGALEFATLRVPFAGAAAKVTSKTRATATVENGEATIRSPRWRLV